MREFSDQELVRREKCENIRKLGIDPFGHKFERTDYAEALKEKYKDVDHDAFENMNDTATVAGRIMFIRKMGKASFFSIKAILALPQYIHLIAEPLYISALTKILYASIISIRNTILSYA